MKKPKIKIDYKICKRPENCRKCLNICPTAVFNLYFTDKDHHDPKNWIVDPVFSQLCTNCQACVEACPISAISIKI